MHQMENKADGLAGRRPVGDATFRFACHSAVACFTRCCHDADMHLYPYDIIRLKHCPGMHSKEFLAQHTITALRDNAYFPNVMLKMSDGEGRPCTVPSARGCTVYEGRPYSCRAYPLEPAIYGGDHGQVTMRCYLARHSHCLGHQENQSWTAAQWMTDQQMDRYNDINARWARIASQSGNNPFGRRGVESQAMKMTFMASYNMDTFRRFVFESSFLSRFRVPRECLEAIDESDSELLLLGFDWIPRFLLGQGPFDEHV